MEHPEKELPQKFIDRLSSQLPSEELNQFKNAINQLPVVSLRINLDKPTSKFDEQEVVPWCEHGRYLPSRPLFAKDPLIFSGAYYVQEASSMFLNLVLKEVLDFNQELKVLDLCAAPGGKSTLINSLLDENSLLISNEVVKNRVSPLVENLTRWGKPNAIVSSNEVSDFRNLKHFFDAIVVDAPCSGEGMFRKDPKAINMWSEPLVHGCAARQRQILDDIITCLKPGGFLIYSTCTFAPSENEGILQWLTEKDLFSPVRINEGKNWGVTETTVGKDENTFYGYRFYPHKTKGEGFFITCLQKKDDGYVVRNKKQKRKGKVEFLPKKFYSLLDTWIENPDSLDYILKNEHIYAIPKKLIRDFSRVSSELNLVFHGIDIGKFKSGKIIPSHHLAVSTILSSKTPSIELNYEQAITYLRKEEFDFDSKGLKSWVVVKYQGHCLGWIKILNNRFNNYYPIELRLRKKF